VAGLPAPHSAAALNDLPRLRALAAKKATLLASLDQSQRQPIFYAAAYGHAEAVRFLLETLPDAGLGVQFGLQWVRGDVFGDTPLHAAASSGSEDCCELLLAALTSQPSVVVDTGVDCAANLRNSMQMTPAHLASSAESLQVLYKYSADIQATDTHLRTPLFIACAMNRDQCAEFIISCLDHTADSTADDDLLRKDGRGDTPLHAAACNGAIECLLLLLQHGIDPRLKNASGLRAIDLAVRNRHRKCKDILAEYHLHYCTSSEFDSVLFLATLEGHRQIASQIPHLAGQERAAEEEGEGPPAEGYRIIQSNPFEELGAQVQGAQGDDAQSLKDVLADAASADTGKPLVKAGSMFTLRTNKSMRLQRWGAWIAYHDTQSHSIFWYNHETAKGQWEQPEQVAQLMSGEHVSEKNALGGGKGKTLDKKISMRLKRTGDWIEYVTESGRTFYYNARDGSFQWECPDGVEKRAGEQAQSEQGGAQQQAQDEHYPWRGYLDQDSGALFWYNELTGVSTWDMPAVLEQPQLDRLDYSAAEGLAYSMDMEGQRDRTHSDADAHTRGHDDAEDDGVFAVHDHENDLGI